MTVVKVGAFAMADKPKLLFHLWLKPEYIVTYSQYSCDGDISPTPKCPEIEQTPVRKGCKKLRFQFLNA